MIKEKDHSTLPEMEKQEKQKKQRINKKYTKGKYHPYWGTIQT